jgi:hypothetical protein
MRVPQRLIYFLPIAAVFYVAILLCWVTPAKAYITIARWNGNSTEWWTDFQSGVASAPFPSTTYSLINTASSRWSNPSTGKNFSIINYTGLFGPVRMYVHKTSFSNSGWPGDPGVNYITLTSGRVTYSALHLNSDWTWNTSCTLSKVDRKADVLTIALHEMGHTVSLNHDSAVTSAVMWPNYTCKQTLTTDDKNGIGALYGP